MAFVGIRPSSSVKVTDELRRIFIRLAIETEPRQTMAWSLMGDDQCIIRGAGCFHKEGKYLLKCVAKNWSRGHLYASTEMHRDDRQDKVFFTVAHGCTFVSTSREALKKLMPETKVEVLHGSGH